MNREIMLWRDSRWVRSDLKQLPPHNHGKPEECDRCNAELYWDFARIARRKEAKDGKASPG
jgi:hypothetical protein